MPRSTAGQVRGRVTALNVVRSLEHAHERTRGVMPSIIYAPAESTHGNFLEASYRRIAARPAWAARLRKAHTAKRSAQPCGPDETVRPWCELDAATSSDALLMNIFCYPRVLAGGRLPALLGLAPGLTPEFGYRPGVAFEGTSKRVLGDRTEIDMRLGHLLVEAKLTESDFQTAPMRLVERYPAFAEVFERDLLHESRRGVAGYQLIRGVLAAQAEDAVFCVFLDAQRRDLIESWYAVMRAVRSLQAQSRLRLVTWQEIAAALPGPLREFLRSKYGIEAAVGG